MIKEDEIIAPSHSQLLGPNSAETGLSDGLGLNNIWCRAGNWEKKVKHGEIDIFLESTYEVNPWSLAACRVGFKDDLADEGDERSYAASTTHQH
ncbi:hypothetical protein OIU79_022656 [Salix purpurea]|uniref:Uncharacterized protein n=1 Tax=Salix purpurea TaxID=77065 RepID=A0A9Q1AD79_SALPP|nr:hypothetical protein OIU79_022656 [Salix purpurea]